MFYRRKASQRFSPIVRKENKNYLNIDGIALEGHQSKKRFVLRLDSGKKHKSTASKQKGGQKQAEKKKQSQRLFGFKTLKKPTRPLDLPPTQCPRLDHKYSQSEKDSLELSISPKFLVFKDQPNLSSDQKDSEWKIERIEVLPPSKGFFYDFVDSDDQQMEKLCKKYEDYDMDSDKENMPYSDGDQSKINSEQEEQNDEQLTDDQENQLIHQQKNLNVPRFSYDSMLKKKLQHISQQDETSITNGFEFRN